LIFLDTVAACNIATALKTMTLAARILDSARMWDLTPPGT
jgi:hypothetical protein